jgi:zinc protease
MFGIMTGQMKATLANRSALPEAAFSDALNAALTQDHRRARPMTPALVLEMNLDKSLAFYKERFADASGFIFVFVGSFDPVTMKPLVERYLGSLPGLNRHETWKDVGIRPPAGVVEKRIEKGIEPKSQIGLVFTGPFQYDQMHRLVIRAMAETLQGNLHSTLREDLGGTYNVTVGSGYAKIPTEKYSVSINFGCNPARADDLLRTVFEQIDQFKISGPTAGQVADARSALKRDYETNSQQNGYVLSQLLFKYQYGEDVRDVFNMQPYYDKLTPSIIREAARQYLNTDRYVKVMLFPEKK